MSVRDWRDVLISVRQIPDYQELKDLPVGPERTARITARVLLNQGDGTFGTTNLLADHIAMMVLHALKQDGYAVRQPEGDEECENRIRCMKCGRLRPERYMQRERAYGVVIEFCVAEASCKVAKRRKP